MMTSNYEGEMKHGFYHGKGRFEWPENGTVYEGEFVMGDATGNGTIVWKNGFLYSGEVKNYIRHGHGICSKHDDGVKEQKYDGNWLNGKRNGKGKQTYDTNKNTYYIGDWKDNKRNGFGTMHFESGSIYTGYFEDDVRSGVGVMRWSNCQIYIGTFENNLPSCYGEFIYDSNDNINQKDQILSTGNITQNIKRRKSFVNNRGRNFYRGQFSKNFRHGYGTFFYANGSQYTGMWQNNLKHGLGVFLGTNGSISVRKYDCDMMVIEVSTTNKENVIEPIAPIQIHIEDLYNSNYDTDTCPKSDNQIDMHDWNRLLLKYVSTIRQFYLKKSTEIISAESNQSFQPASETIDDTFNATEFVNFTQKLRSMNDSKQSMRVSQVLHLLRITGVLTSLFNVSDAIQCWRQLHHHRHSIAMKLLQTSISNEDDTFIRIFRELEFPLQNENMFMSREANYLLSDYNGFLFDTLKAQLESYYHASSSQEESTKSLLTDRSQLEESDYPVTESELCEWLIRCIHSVGSKSSPSHDHSVVDNTVGNSGPVESLLFDSFYRYLYGQFEPYASREVVRIEKSYVTVVNKDNINMKF